MPGYVVGADIEAPAMVLRSPYGRKMRVVAQVEVSTVGYPRPRMSSRRLIHDGPEFCAKSLLPEKM